MIELATSSVSEFVVRLAEEISAGRVRVSGTVDMTSVGYATLCTTTLEDAAPPPDLFTLSMQLDVRRIHGGEA